MPEPQALQNTLEFCGEHGVEHPKRFKASQPARLCAKDVFGLLEELRANARENQSQLELETTDERGLGENPGAALEAR